MLMTDLETGVQQGTTVIILAVPRMLMTDLETGVQQGTTVIILAVPRMLMTDLETGVSARDDSHHPCRTQDADD
jgi:hypothetical protein